MKLLQDILLVILGGMINVIAQFVVAWVLHSKVSRTIKTHFNRDATLKNITKVIDEGGVENESQKSEEQNW